MDPTGADAMLAARAAGAALATAGATGTLAWLAGRWGHGRFAALSALVLGAEGSAPERGDLRFAAVVASLTAGLSWTVALDAQVRALPPGARVTALAIGLPAAALAVTGVADLIAHRRRREPADLGDRAAEVARKAGFDAITSDAIGSAVRAGEVACSVGATVAASPAVQAVAGAAVRGGRSVLATVVDRAMDAVVPGRAERERRAAVVAQVEEALAEVRAARARSDDDRVREALASIEEQLLDYAAVLEDDGADVDRIAVRVSEVTALVRSCDEDDATPSFRVLGLARDASLDEARRVYAELARIYRSGGPSVDPEKWKEIAAAFARVRAVLEEKHASA